MHWICLLLIARTHMCWTENSVKLFRLQMGPKENGKPTMWIIESKDEITVLSDFAQQA